MSQRLHAAPGSQARRLRASLISLLGLLPIENLMDRLMAYVGLIPWEEGSGGPCRVIATW